MKNDRVVWPVFLAALNVIAAGAVFLFVSIAYHWPNNLPIGLWLLSCLVAYGFAVWGFQEGRRCG